MMVMPFFSAMWAISRARWIQLATLLANTLRSAVPSSLVLHTTPGRTYSLGDTLSNDGNGLDLGVLHQLQGGAVDTSGRGEVDDNVNIGVLAEGLVDLLVDGQQSLAGAPVHLAHELTTESVDDTGNRGGLALADEVEVEHALDGSGLETVDEASGLVVEEGMGGQRAQRTAGSRKALDLVVGRQVAIDAGGCHDEVRVVGMITWITSRSVSWRIRDKTQATCGRQLTAELGQEERMRRFRRERTDRKAGVWC